MRGLNNLYLIVLESVEWIEPEKKIQEDRNEFNEFEEL